MKRSLEEAARAARADLFLALRALGGGHFGACLSEIDILTYLYFEEMNVRPQEPDWPDRDRFVLSKGHGGFGLYSVLAERGFFPRERLSALENGVMLPKHADKHRVPGVDVSTGSLGPGLSIACGMALAAKRSGSSVRVFALLGDGECNEGQIWEAAAFAAKYKLDNLIAAVDANGLQFDGRSEEIMPMEPFAAKWRAFGWNTIEANGHDFEAIRAAYAQAGPGRRGGCDSAAGAEDGRDERPSMIIFRTVKGKGLSFMENEVLWHSGNCDDEQFAAGCRELGIDCGGAKEKGGGAQ